MSNDEIIEMARQAGAYCQHQDFNMRHSYEFQPDQLETFAKLVAAKERGEIAQFIERTELGSLPEETALHYARLFKGYATAIRARGEA